MSTGDEDGVLNGVDFVPFDACVSNLLSFDMNLMSKGSSWIWSKTYLISGGGQTEVENG